MRNGKRDEMLVTFISECEKKALKRTRRVLDAFANRIGNNTWQTPITQEGLEAVYHLLRKTASKNTAVSCHQLKTRVRTKLLWVVGKREKFNTEGVVAVNYTNQNILGNYLESDWKYLPSIKALSVFAALLHDFGKASILFQEKLTIKGKTPSDPLRHEWISLLFFVALVDGRRDEDWMSDLKLNDNLHFTLSNLQIDNIQKPLKTLTPIATMIAWLIVTHHKMPSIKEYGNKEVSTKVLLGLIVEKWGYKTRDEEYYKKCLKKCFEFEALPSQSVEWLSSVKQCAKELHANKQALEEIATTSSQRVILLYSRMSLMLADHYYSSQGKDTAFSSNLKLFANTDGEGNLKQQLDEHLLGVAKQTAKNTKRLPDFEGVFNAKIRTGKKKELAKKSTDGFQWQDKIVDKIVKWRKESEKIDKHHFGFFAVNMASTGKGKTFANAKIMQALSPDKDSLRYILALGLRTLTLQTGNEYKNKIGLSDQELAVLIGSKAILSLEKADSEQEQSDGFASGSESSESLNDGEMIYEGSFDEKGLSTVLRYKQDKQFLHAPVLTCTIDYIIRATEVTRGGKYILPTLRLMSSDLVIDEVDDFDNSDLIAIGRLIHLAGMLGRKVMISSATIPPDLAQGYFNAYQAGWSIFANMREKNQAIGCAWIDEFKKPFVCSVSSIEAYQEKHKSFVEQRVKNLSQEKVRRKANIIKCVNSKEDFPEHYFQTIQDEVACKHYQHSFKDVKTNKNISIGVVRMANVKPCIKLTHFLLNASISNMEIKTMAYHSRQVLLMRHHQEKYLDKILKRHQGEEAILSDEIIRGHIDSSSCENIVFVLVVTPVEEVGRDHDFDWAIIEPSSYRSFIQLAGRVLRHRNKDVNEPNIGILQYNYRHYHNNEQCAKTPFCHPGYQSKKDDLSSNNLEELVDTQELAEKLDATNRIEKNNSSEFANLEHKVISNLLTSGSKGASTMQGWIEDAWWLSGVHQEYIRFRDSAKDEILFLTLSEGFALPDGSGAPSAQNTVKTYLLEEKEMKNIWLQRDYESLLKEQAGEKDLDEQAFIYGEITLPTYGEVLRAEEFIYNEQLGLCQSD